VCLGTAARQRGRREQREGKKFYQVSLHAPFISFCHCRVECKGQNPAEPHFSYMQQEEREGQFHEYYMNIAIAVRRSGDTEIGSSDAKARFRDAEI